jgi:oxygen-independent coproporphyrinogen-3 oxidase
MYWEGDKDFLSFGMGASNLLNMQRINRPKNLKKYFKYVDELISLDGRVGQQYIDEEKSSKEKIKSILIGNLRTMCGLNLEKISS